MASTWNALNKSQLLLLSSSSPVLLLFGESKRKNFFTKMKTATRQNILKRHEAYVKRLGGCFLSFKRAEIWKLQSSSYYNIYQTLTCNRITLGSYWNASSNSVSLSGSWDSVFLMSPLVIPISLNYTWSNKII